jgi:hypothetical protein
MKKVYQPPCDKDGMHLDGHKVFTHQNRIYFADGSGDTPAQTDDGPLFVDTTRPAVLSISRHDQKLCVEFDVVVERDHNSSARVMTSFATAKVVMGLAHAMTVKRSSELAKLLDQVSALEQLQAVAKVADAVEIVPQKIKVKTSELTGHALNFVVSQIEGVDHDTAILNITEGDDNGWKLDYLTWEQGGPIIEHEMIATSRGGSYEEHFWMASLGFSEKRIYGPTPLIAGMRCYVASKLGDEVEVPVELV